MLVCQELIYRGKDSGAVNFGTKVQVHPIYGGPVLYDRSLSPLGGELLQVHNVIQKLLGLSQGLLPMNNEL